MVHHSQCMGEGLSSSIYVRVMISFVGIWLAISIHWKKPGWMSIHTYFDDSNEEIHDVGRPNLVGFITHQRNFKSRLHIGHGAIPIICGNSSITSYYWVSLCRIFSFFDLTCNDTWLYVRVRVHFECTPTTLTNRRVWGGQILIWW